MAGVGRALPPGARARRALPQPGAGRDVPADRRRGRRRRPRDEQIDAARDALYRGFVAEAIDGFSAEHGGLLTAGDLAGWEATVEAPATLDYRGYTVLQDRAVGPGPGVPPAARAARRLRPRRPRSGSAEYVHTVVECAKLAFADREACVRRPGVRRRAARAAALGATTTTSGGAGRRGGARGELRPAAAGRAARRSVAGASATVGGAGEPTRGDTCHLDVADRFGQPGLRDAERRLAPELAGRSPRSACRSGTRAQMFWLEEGLPASLAPGQRPRTTLSPSLALRDGAPYLAFGTPGGDQQDQWSLHVFLGHVALRARPAGGDRRADVPHRPLPVARSTRGSSSLARSRSRGAWSRTCRRAPRPRARRARSSRLGARPGQRGRAGGRHAEGGREPARDAGLRGGPMTVTAGVDHVVSRDDIIWAFGPDLEPVLEVEPGDDRHVRDERLLQRPDPQRGRPRHRDRLRADQQRHGPGRRHAAPSRATR